MILGIMGGMGPLATSDLFSKIIELTDAKSDSEHMHIVIDNNTKIPDRTSYIMGYGEDPRVEMIKSLKRLERSGADYIVIACNTAHYFYDDIVKHTSVKLVHMIEETANFLKRTYPDKSEYLLLSTKGTYKSEIYKRSFEKFGLSILEPSEEDKGIIMEWIYKIKSGDFDISGDEYIALTSKYLKDDISTVVLGCTELPILAGMINLKKEEYINPTLVIARYCIELGKSSLREL